MIGRSAGGALSNIRVFPLSRLFTVASLGLPARFSCDFLHNFLYEDRDKTFPVKEGKMPTNESYLPITSLADGEEGIIRDITGGHALISRLAGMGIVLNTKIRFLHASGGLVIVQVAETRVALGHGEAAKILVSPLAPPARGRENRRRPRPLLVALAGQPNAGKSTVFNILTGLSQHVGNWPGKTVEKKEGAHTADGQELRIVDLPGTYSLTAFSEEERVARDFIIHEAPDVIVLLVNAAALERSLYLLSELLLLGPPVVVAVNMLDVAEQQGIRIDTEALEKSLGIPVVPMVATKNRGIRELVERIIAVSRGEVLPRTKPPQVRADHRELFLELTELIREAVPPPYTVALGRRQADGGGSGGLDADGEGSSRRLSGSGSEPCWSPMRIPSTPSSAAGTTGSRRSPAPASRASGWDRSS